MTLFILFACLNQPQFPYLEWGDTYPPSPQGATIVAAHTYKARGVVVPDGLGVPESLQHRVCLDDLILQGPLTQRETQGWVLPGEPGLSQHCGFGARSQ